MNLKTHRFQIHLILLFFSCLVFASTPNAIAIENSEIPKQLREWVPWVMKDHKQYACPRLYNADKAFQCVWASALEIKINKRKGRFSQNFNVLADSWVYLPGGRNNWPQQITNNDRSAVLGIRNGYPAMYLKKGKYRIKGAFVWEKIPEFIQVPKATGIIRLWLNNQKVVFPNLNQQGKLWIQKDTKNTNRESADLKNRVDIQVFRKISDDIPMLVIVHIILNYSGEAEELLLGNPILKNFIPLSLKSDLPVHLKPDNTLHIQARPGKWVIQVVSRSTKLQNELILEHPGKNWPREEIWSFDSRNHLRETKTTGGEIIDPQQTDLPRDWRNFPAFRIATGNRFQIEEIKRGDPQTAENRFNLTRNIWLDFDGKGAVIRDTITGKMSRGWRLMANELLKLGRVAVNGKDKLITEDQNGQKGVEIRSRQIEVTAESRMEHTQSSFSAVHWLHDFDRLSINFHLPPGWKAWYVSGADRVSGSWLSNWSLLDLFMIFIIFLSVIKLWGRRWGALTLITLLLSYHLPDSPRWIWLHVITAFALYKVFPEGWIRRGINVYRLASLTGLIIIVLPFMVQQAREGLYPQLEYSEKSSSSFYYQSETDQYEMDEEEAVPNAEPEIMNRQKMDMRSNIQQSEIINKGKSFSKRKSRIQRAYKKQTFREFDPKAKVQTGPGVPVWKWDTIVLSWNGPVEKDQMIRAVITPPWVKRILNFLITIFWGLILACIMGFRYDGKKGFSLPNISWKNACPFLSKGLPILFLLYIPCHQIKADIPSKELLRELQTTLLEAPKCSPKCASISNVSVTVRNTALRMRIEAHAQAETAFPLPEGAGQWVINKGWIDGKKITGFSRSSNNQLLMNLPKGRHQILLEGPLENKDIIQIGFPLKPYQINVSSVGWRVEGVFQNRMRGNRIQLKKIKKTVKQNSSKPDFKDLPPFVKIERIIKLGLSWQIETTIRRVSHNNDVIIVQLPLLAGESITSEHIKVINGKAEIQLAPQQNRKTLYSVFKKSDSFQLSATKTSEWIESWKIYISPVWHVTFEGFPAIHHRNLTQKWLPEWRPWPGEVLNVHVTRPAGTIGQTMTIDQSVLKIDTGQRTANVVLSFQLRSSIGGRHTITLPGSSKLRQLTISGKEQPYQQQDQTITFPVLPGAQEIQLSWIQKKELTSFFKTPEIKLGLPSVNSEIKIKMPPTRWILWVSGPRLGPAVLFWGNLFVILIVAFALGKLKITPLKSRHWIILVLGLSGVSIYFTMIFVIWILAIGFRSKLDTDTHRLLFNSMQVTLVFLSIAAMASLYAVISTGLLGGPNMIIAGNGSYYNELVWYQDRALEYLPQTTVVSLPIMAYRGTMLIWAFWLAFSLIKWFRWFWESFNMNGLWKSLGVVDRITGKKSLDKKAMAEDQTL